MKRKFRGISIIIVALIIVSCVSCSQNTNLPEAQAEVTSINDDGTITVTDKDGKTYIFKQIKAESTTEEKTVFTPVNVKDFGAVGDGVADDYEAFRLALLSLDNGGSLYIPKGTYLITKGLNIKYDNVKLYGDKGMSKLVFRREQTDGDSLESASFIKIVSGVKNAAISDLILEYDGTFFGEAGKSYSGKVCGIYVMDASDIHLYGLEISKFNHDGIYVMGGSATPARRVIIENCHLHHNRVAGILYAYVDGLSITGNNMEYNGAESDGGTGYGCAGAGGTHPKNVQVIGNIANYNYRKGIDVHAGDNIIIDGNTCKANRLYGIYAEGIYTSDIIITNNIVSDMNFLTTGIEGYETIMAISFGTYEAPKDNAYHNFIVANNVVRNFGLTSGVSLPLYCYAGMERAIIKINDNTIDCETIDYVLSINTKYAEVTGSNSEMSVDFSGNQISVKNTRGIAFIMEGNYINFSSNIINLVNYTNGYLMQIGGASKAELIMANNIIRTSNNTTLMTSAGGRSVVKSNNFLNGKAV